MKKQNYIIDEPSQSKITKQAANNIKLKKEPLKIPFPQADDLDKVVDVIYLISSGASTRDDVAGHFEMNGRQGDTILMLQHT